MINGKCIQHGEQSDGLRQWFKDQWEGFGPVLAAHVAAETRELMKEKLLFAAYEEAIVDKAGMDGWLIKLLAGLFQCVLWSKDGRLELTPLDTWPEPDYRTATTGFTGDLYEFCEAIDRGFKIALRQINLPTLRVGVDVVQYGELYWYLAEDLSLENLERKCHEDNEILRRRLERDADNPRARHVLSRLQALLDELHDLVNPPDDTANTVAAGGEPAVAGAGDDNPTEHAG